MAAVTPHTHLVALVRAEVRFENGHRVARHEVAAA